MKKTAFIVTIVSVIVTMFSSCAKEEAKRVSVPPVNDTIVVEYPKEIFFTPVLSVFPTLTETLGRATLDFEQEAYLRAEDSDTEYILPSKPTAMVEILLDKDTILVDEFSSPLVESSNRTEVKTTLGQPISAEFTRKDAFSDSQSANISAEWAYSFIKQNVDSIAFPHVEIEEVEFSHADTTSISDDLLEVGLNYNVVYSYDDEENYERATETTKLRPYYFQKVIRKPEVNELIRSYLICDTTMRYEAESAHIRIIVRRVKEYTLAPNDTVPVNNREFPVIRVGKAGSETLYVENGTPIETEEHSEITTKESTKGSFFIKEEKSTHTWTALFEGEKVTVPHVDAIVLTVQSITWSDGETSFAFPFTGEVKCTQNEMIMEDNMGDDYIKTRVFSIETTLNGNFFTKSTGKTVLRVHP